MHRVVGAGLRPAALARARRCGARRSDTGRARCYVNDTLASPLTFTAQQVDAIVGKHPAYPISIVSLYQSALDVTPLAGSAANAGFWQQSKSRT